MTMRLPSGYRVEQLSSFELPSGRRVRMIESLDSEGRAALVIETETEGRAPLRITIPDRNLETLRDALAMIESRRARRDVHRTRARAEDVRTPGVPRGKVRP